MKRELNAISILFFLIRPANEGVSVRGNIIWMTVYNANIKATIVCYVAKTTTDQQILLNCSVPSFSFSLLLCVLCIFYASNYKSIILLRDNELSRFFHFQFTFLFNFCHFVSLFVSIFSLNIIVFINVWCARLSKQIL